MTARLPLACAAALTLALANASAQTKVESTPAQASEHYVWRNVVIGGGGFVTGLIFHPREKGLLYARTDVGGAYRWDAPARKWIPITDWIGAADANLTGIESLALDPANPQFVYLAAGTYSGLPAAILRSGDQGRTWQRTDVPFRMGGNELGRANGERLAVDPNSGGILFFGSRNDGLWQSDTRGASWRKVESFPPAGAAPLLPASDSVPSRFSGRQQPVGIVCVTFDPSSSAPGSPTPVIYAAVSTTGTNLFRSTNAGGSWQAVSGQPVGFCPNRVVWSPDGWLYLSYGKQPGPVAMTDGAVWKYHPKDGVWTDITPLKPAEADQPFGYGAVAVDARNPQTIMVTTFCHWKPLDEVFRSTNGGASWTALLQEAQWDHSSAPYTQTRTPHWLGDLKINPFAADQVLFTAGYGIWNCNDATQADAGKPTHWEFFNHGLEETVPLALISPPQGAHLLSGVGDIDGFRHDDLTKSPAQGSFSGPRFSNTESLAFAAQSPEVVVRAGTGDRADVHAAYSLDGGNTWRAFASEPESNAVAGSIAISADAKTVVWTPRRCAPYVSVDWGKTWKPCGGLTSGATVIADPLNPARFYAFSTSAGRCLVSTNGAADFAATKATLSPVEESSRRFGGGCDDAQLLASGIAGHLWLTFGDRGLFHSTNSGASFVKLQSVEAACSLGVGKAASDGGHPSLYLAGRIGGVQALFRSDDAGATWKRLNDDANQFGTIRQVTGDPRIFGRVYFATGGRGILCGEPTSKISMGAPAPRRRVPRWLPAGRQRSQAQKF